MFEIRKVRFLADYELKEKSSSLKIKKENFDRFSFPHASLVIVRKGDSV